MGYSLRRRKKREAPTKSFPTMNSHSEASSQPVELTDDSAHSTKRPRPESPLDASSLTKPRLTTQTDPELLWPEGLRSDVNPLAKDAPPAPDQTPAVLTTLLPICSSQDRPAPSDQQSIEKKKPTRRRPKFGTYTELSYHPGLPEDFPPWLIG